MPDPTPPARDRPTAPARDRPTAPAPDRPASPAPAGPAHAVLVLGPVLLLTVVLSVWAAFLVPVRVDGVPVMLWLLPLAAMLAVARWAGGLLGLTGVLPPALVWLGVSWLALGARRAEGDLVVPATLSGQLYLYGGLLAWAAVVLRTQAAER